MFSLEILISQTISHSNFNYVFKPTLKLESSSVDQMGCLKRELSQWWNPMTKIKTYAEIDQNIYDLHGLLTYLCLKLEIVL